MAPISVPPDSDDAAYRVEQRPSGWCVVNASGRVLMTCGDARSAAHYATLLNEAWQAGFRAGHLARGDDD